jgi:lipid-A-disaccharide synthase
MRYYIIAGEASGDLHASNLIREIRELDPSASFRGWGGDLMASQGLTLVKHFREVAFMGFIEVARNLRTILKALKDCKNDIMEFRPDALILVDYPGFNLKIAEFAHRNRIRIIYYISPQVWAWRKSRAYKIRDTVDKMLVILPFEEEFYRQYDYPVKFVGHPLLDVVNQPSNYEGRAHFISENGIPDKPIVALLPGSRKQEITRMLPVMARISVHFPDYEFVVAAAPSQNIELYNRLLSRYRLKVIADQSYEILRYSTAALVTSGTATLETALFGIPEVVCYKGSNISYRIARHLVDVKYISLVNLIMNRELVKELIQNEFNAKNLTRELNLILEPKRRTLLQQEYDSLRKRLGESGASARAAIEITNFLK